MRFDVRIGDVAAFDAWLMDGAPEVRTFEPAHVQALMDLAASLDGIGALVDARGATSIWSVSLPLGLVAVLLEWAQSGGVALVVDDHARPAVAAILLALENAAGTRARTIDLTTVKAEITASMPEDWRTSW